MTLVEFTGYVRMRSKEKALELERSFNTIPPETLVITNADDITIPIESVEIGEITVSEKGYNCDTVNQSTVLTINYIKTCKNEASCGDFIRIEEDCYIVINYQNDFFLYSAEKCKSLYKDENTQSIDELLSKIANDHPHFDIYKQV